MSYRIRKDWSTIARYPKKYEDYMHSTEWRHISHAVIERDKVCQHCGEAKGLQAHHKIYDNLFNELEHLDDLIALCNRCHPIETSKMRRARYRNIKRENAVTDVIRKTPTHKRKKEDVKSNIEVQDSRSSTPRNAQWSTRRPSKFLDERD